MLAIERRTTKPLNCAAMRASKKEAHNVAGRRKCLLGPERAPGSGAAPRCRGRRRLTAPRLCSSPSVARVRRSRRCQGRPRRAERSGP
jgi:hypothetical protein